jgi:hypothetical protein
MKKALLVMLALLIIVFVDVVIYTADKHLPPPGKPADIKLARAQNPQKAAYADKHGCLVDSEWEPNTVVGDDGVAHYDKGVLFYSCPNKESLIMEFDPRF